LNISLSIKCLAIDSFLYTSRIGAIRCQVLKLKCTKFDFRAGRTYNAPPNLLAVFKGPTSKGRGRKREGRRGERRGEANGR